MTDDQHIQPLSTSPVTLTPDDINSMRLGPRFSSGDVVVASSESSDSLSASVEELAIAKRAMRKLEKLRLRGRFIPNDGGPNRKQRRAMKKGKE